MWLSLSLERQTLKTSHYIYHPYTDLKQKNCFYASYPVNHIAFLAFHHPQVLKKTEEKLGKKKEVVCDKSIEYAIMMEKYDTINKLEPLTYDKYKRLGIVESLDMHWPQQGSSRSWCGCKLVNSNPHNVDIGKTIFCKSCRFCNKLLKQTKDCNEIWNVPAHRCYKKFAKTKSSKLMEPRVAVKIVREVATHNDSWFLWCQIWISYLSELCWQVRGWIS